MNNIEITAFQIVVFLFSVVLYDPLLGRKIGKWF